MTQKRFIGFGCCAIFCLCFSSTAYSLFFVAIVMSAAATGGTIVINSAPTRPCSSVALDYEMGLVRVSASSAAMAHSGFRVRPNDVAMIAPSTPKKLVRSCPSTPTGLRTPPRTTLMTGIVNKPNNKRSKIAVGENDETVNGSAVPTEHDYSGEGVPHKLIMQGKERVQELLLTQLDLIKKQSEAIISKDRQLRELRRENRVLQQRLLNLEHNAPNNTSTGILKMNTKSDSVITQMPTSLIKKVPQTTVLTKDKAVETTSELWEHYNKALKSKNSFRKRKSSAQTSSISTTQKERIAAPADDAHLMSANLMTTTPYYTFMGEDFINSEAKEIKSILHQAEVPGWRTIVVSPSYHMEGTENIEDDTMLKRHSKLEFDEKRRKRWDMQRLRQQRQTEKLRARHDPIEAVTNSSGTTVICNNQQPKNMKKGAGTSSNTENSVGGDSSVGTRLSALVLPVNPGCGGGSGLNDDYLTTLQPLPEQATHLHVSEKLPVNAFGFFVPVMLEKEFSLPWLRSDNSDEGEKKPNKKCTGLLKSDKQHRSKNGVIPAWSPTPHPKQTKKVYEKMAANSPLTHTKSIINCHVTSDSVKKRQPAASTYLNNGDV